MPNDPNLNKKVLETENDSFWRSQIHNFCKFLFNVKFSSFNVPMHLSVDNYIDSPYPLPFQNSIRQFGCFSEYNFATFQLPVFCNFILLYCNSNFISTKDSWSFFYSVILDSVSKLGTYNEIWHQKLSNFFS